MVEAWRMDDNFWLFGSCHRCLSEQPDEVDDAGRIKRERRTAPAKGQIRVGECRKDLL